MTRGGWRSTRRVLSGAALLGCIAFVSAGAGAAPYDPAAFASTPGAPAPQREPQTFRLTVHPQPTTRPALQYRLLPDATDRTTGNAATVYMLAFQLHATKHAAGGEKLPPGEAAKYGMNEEDAKEKVDLYQDVPFDRLPLKEAEEFLAGDASVLDLMDVAARRDRCQWDLPIREQGFRLLLPHLNTARNASRVLTVRARVDVAKKDYQGAVRSFQTEFSLARDLNQQPLLIQSLVGIGIAAQTMSGVQEMVQQPDAPNLYWALADLPRPFADMHAALEGERGALYYTFPQLKRLRDGGPFTADDWRDVLKEMSQWSGGAHVGEVAPLASVASGVILYPRAKAYLLDHGFSREQVEAMPVAVTLARYYVATYDERYDEALKWAGLPYWQARVGLQRSEEEFRRIETDTPGNPLLAILPAINRAMLQGPKLDRQIAAVQIVEAVRDYAARHDGKPPARLDDLTDTPAPLDPTTGKAFGYTVDGNRVTLESLSPAGADPRDGLRVEVMLAVK